MKFVKAFCFVVLIVAVVFYWSQTGNLDQQDKSSNSQGLVAGVASPSQIEKKNNVPGQILDNPAETAPNVTDFSEQTSIIEKTKTITLLAEQSLTVWPQGCNLVVLEKNNKTIVNDGESVALEANSNEKRIIHIVEQGHFKHRKNTTRFSSTENSRSVSEQEFDEQFQVNNKAGTNRCLSRHQINQA